MYTPPLEFQLFEGTNKVSSLGEHNILKKELMFEGITYYTDVLMI